MSKEKKQCQKNKNHCQNKNSIKIGTLRCRERETKKTIKLTEVSKKKKQQQKKTKKQTKTKANNNNN